ncbi:flagellar assembly protein FliH [Halomonas binhaiensis]|uniref:Flagellar assembly protein FliH n=1 Tax=Halomonas binhaiensis TaxID=2562282 RepID=A0A5C1NN09_9GAMM|nr:flagellar assembly protein FliH [Halomonas binhaiensis]QEM83828.1 flagellar assembly protein FliH [Halomonas binhaiensis]
MSDQPIAAPAAWQPWCMDELSVESSCSADESSCDDDDGALLSPDELYHKAWLQGIEQGRREGHEQGHEAGFMKGMHEGLAEGRSQAEAEIAEALEKRAHEALSPLSDLIENFHRALKDLDTAIAAQLIDLALATGRQLAGDALKARPRQIVSVVEELLRSDPPLVGSQRLWLHPQDLVLVERHLGDTLAAAGWTLKADDSLHRGGCRITSEYGEIDATWEQRWQSVSSQVRRRGSSSGTQ